MGLWKTHFTFAPSLEKGLESELTFKVEINVCQAIGF